MAVLARLIVRTLSNIDDEMVEREVRDEVMALAERFPAPA